MKTLSDVIGYVEPHHVVADIKHANPVIKVEFIKEFIKKLKEELRAEHMKNCCVAFKDAPIFQIIDKLAGDALCTKDEGEEQ